MIVFDISQFPFDLRLFAVFVLNGLFNMRSNRGFSRFEGNRYFDCEVGFCTELFHEGGGEILFEQVDVVNGQTGGAFGRQAVQEDRTRAAVGEFVFEGLEETLRYQGHGVFRLEEDTKGEGNFVSMNFNTLECRLHY